jgi:hypothetical protein
MAVEVRDNASTSGIDITSLTRSIDPDSAGGGTNLVLLVLISWYETTTTIEGVTLDGVTFNGVPMTLHSSFVFGLSNEIFVLTGVLAGSHNVVASWSSPDGAKATAVLTAISFANVHQTTPLGTAQTNSNALSTTPTVTVLGVSADNRILDHLAVSQGATTATRSTNSDNGDRSLHANVATGGPAGGRISGSVSSDLSEVGNVNMDWLLSAARLWNIQGVEIKVAPTTILKDLILSGGIIPFPR